MHCVEEPQSVNTGGRCLLRECSSSWFLLSPIEMFLILPLLPQLRLMGIGDENETSLLFFSDFAQQLSG